MKGSGEEYFFLPGCLLPGGQSQWAQLSVVSCSPRCSARRGVAQAQPFPSRPITIIAAGAAGGPTDTITRIVADAMTRTMAQAWDQPVVVEAIGGSTVGPQRGALARPDGYTLLINNIGFAASATLYRKLPYNVLESFAPLGLVSDAAMTLVARPGLPGERPGGISPPCGKAGTS